MKDALKNYSSLESPHTRISQCLLAIHENRVNEVDQVCKVVMNTLVNQWMSTPAPLSRLPSHFSNI